MAASWRLIYTELPRKLTAETDPSFTADFADSTDRGKYEYSVIRSMKSVSLVVQPLLIPGRAPWPVRARLGHRRARRSGRQGGNKSFWVPGTACIGIQDEFRKA